jgi:D-methionine transport system substrate-binding protein
MSKALASAASRRARLRLGLIALALLSLFLVGWSLLPRAPKHPGLAVGVLGGPEAEVLEFVRSKHPELELNVVRYDRPSQLRAALKAGDLAAASFETGVTLHETNSDSDLDSAGLTLTLPLSFYSKRVKSLSEVGPGSVVAISSEPEAQSRALLLLFSSGLIGFPEELAARVRLADVTGNPHHFELRALPPNALGAALTDASLVALEYQAAAQLALAPARHALLMEDGFSPFAQVLTVRRSDLATPPAWLAKLRAAYYSPEVKTFILRQFEDSVRRPW